MMSERVDHPAHYLPGPYEAIVVIEKLGMGFSDGNAAKYLCRAGRKEDAAEDLEKAAWYLQRFGELRFSGRGFPTTPTLIDPLERHAYAKEVAEAWGLSAFVKRAWVRLVVLTTGHVDLEEVRRTCGWLESEAKRIRERGEAGDDA